MIDTSTIIKNQDIKLGTHIKATICGSLDVVTHTVNAVADLAINTRKANEVIYTSLNKMVLDDKLEYAAAVAAGVKQLEEAGMSKEEAQTYLGQ
jgi:hypothetical protein